MHWTVWRLYCSYFRLFNGAIPLPPCRGYGRPSPSGLVGFLAVFFIWYVIGMPAKFAFTFCHFLHPPLDELMLHFSLLLVVHCPRVVDIAGPHL